MTDEPKTIPQPLKKPVLTSHRRMEDLVQINKDRHANERKMAWVALWFMMFITTVTIFIAPPDQITGYTGFIGAVLISFSGIVAAYMGFSTWGANKFFNGKGSDVTDGTTTEPEQPAG